MSDPTGPDAPGPAPDADVAWFRSQVDPVVDAAPVPDAWPAIASRVRSGDELAARRSRRPALRWVAVAAVIAVLAGVAVVLTTGSDDGATVVTDTTPTSAAPGWYIPTDLPDGWSLRSASIATTSRPCATVERTWGGSEPGSIEKIEPSLVLTYDGCDTSPMPGPSHRAGPPLGPGVRESEVAEFMSNPGSARVRWQDDGLWTLKGTSLTRDEVLDAAKAIVADPTAAQPIAYLPTTDIDFTPPLNPGPTAVISLTAPSGEVVSYRLAPPGDGPERDPFSTDTAHPIDGKPEAVVLRDAAVGLWSPGPDGQPMCCYPDSRYLGDWPGADLDVPRWLYDYPPPADDIPAGPESIAAHEDLLEQLIASLRPASTAEWRAFLATATEPLADPRLPAAESLATMTRPASAGTSTTAPEGGTATTTATTEPTEPDADPQADGPIVSEPGVATPREEPTGPDAEVNTVIYEGFTDLDGLELRVELPARTMSPFTPTAATVTVRNTTDQPVHITECTRYLTSLGLVPADQPDRPVAHRIVKDCFGTSQRVIAPGATERLSAEWLMLEGFLARHQQPNAGGAMYLGTLPAGDYLAVVDVPGRDSDVRISVPVTVDEPDCATPDALVQRYRFLTQTEAEALAKEEGRAVRVVSVDGEGRVLEDDLRCDRVNLRLENGTVTDALLN